MLGVRSMGLLNRGMQFAATSISVACWWACEDGRGSSNGEDLGVNVTPDLMDARSPSDVSDNREIGPIDRGSPDIGSMRDQGVSGDAAQRDAALPSNGEFPDTFRIRFDATNIARRDGRDGSSFIRCHDKQTNGAEMSWFCNWDSAPIRIPQELDDARVFLVQESIQKRENGETICDFGYYARTRPGEYCIARLCGDPDVGIHYFLTARLENDVWALGFRNLLAGENRGDVSDKVILLIYTDVDGEEEGHAAITVEQGGIANEDVIVSDSLEIRVGRQESQFAVCQGDDYECGFEPAADQVTGTILLE
jgi:hypothetical protein